MADSTAILTGGLTSLPRTLADQFAAQLSEDRLSTKAAMGTRKGALETYQQAIRDVPNMRTGSDAFNAIGEGYFASPEWSWNPAAALASGFQRMNSIQSLRKQQAQQAALAAPSVGYEDAKDLSDKYLSKAMLTPSSLLGYESQLLRTQGSGARAVFGMEQQLFRQNYTEALKTAKGEDAVRLATEATNAALIGMNLDPINPALIRTMVAGATIGANPPAGSPAAGVPGQPGSPNRAGTVLPQDDPLTRLPANVAGAIRKDMASNPGQGPASVNIDPAQLGQAGASGVAGLGTVTGAIPLTTAQPGTRGTPGESVPQRMDRERRENEAKAQGTAAGTEGVKKGMDYRTLVNTEGEGAVEAMRTLHEVKNDLDKFSSTGKLGNVRKLIAQWKVALGSQDANDVADAAAAENADKMSFDLATKTIRAFTPRGTQMELMRAIENNPNLLMTPEGHKRMISFLERRNHDAIERVSHFQDWVKTNKYEGPAGEAKWADHQGEWLTRQADRIAARAGNLAKEQKEYDAQFNGRAIKIKPRWDEEHQSMVADFPDGRTRKVNIK